MDFDGHIHINVTQAHTGLFTSLGFGEGHIYITIISFIIQIFDVVAVFSYAIRDKIIYSEPPGNRTDSSQL